MTWDSSIARRKDGTVVTISGCLDEAAQDAVYDLVVGAVSARGAGVVRLDLAGVSYLGAGGAAALVAAHFVGRGAGCRVTVVRPSAAAERMLRQVGVPDLIGVTRAARPGSFLRRFWGAPVRTRGGAVTVRG